MIGKIKIGISMHGENGAKDINPSINRMRLEPKESLKRIAL